LDSIFKVRNARKGETESEDRRSQPNSEEPMTRSIIAALVAATLGVGFGAQAMAGDRHYDWRDRNRDGRIDWRDNRHYGYGPAYHGRDLNRDGRVDWRDRRYDRIDRNNDGRISEYERWFARRDRNGDGVLSHWER
jgi:hypothetical protein